MATKSKTPVGGIDLDEASAEMAKAEGIELDANGQSELDSEDDAVDTENFDLQDDPDEAMFSWEPKGGLTAPEPRSGMEQKWVRRMAPNGTNDASHLSYQMGRAGWKPRRLETVPEGERALFPMTSDSTFGKVITSGDLMLCERPKALGDKRRAFYAKRTHRQSELVNQEIAAINERAGAGVGNMHVAERRSRVTTRRPIVAAD